MCSSGGALGTVSEQSYEGLERRLKGVFAERTGILRQLSKTSKELDGIKGNLQSLKNDEMVAKKEVQRILELSQKQREEMKSLQTALQKQLDEVMERAEKQQATINFLKTEMERKSKIIKDLQQENKSLKNKLLSGNKLCGLHAEESKKIQAQLKELWYGKKDLVFKGQQLMDLERKLMASKEELEKAALDKESQLKALKDTVHLCFSSVLQNHPPSTPVHLPRFTGLANHSVVTFQQPNAKDVPKILRVVGSKAPSTSEETRKDCRTEKVGETCFQNRTEKWSPAWQEAEARSQTQKSQERPKAGNDVIKPSEDVKEARGGNRETVLGSHN
ncbi:leucine zipper protein 2-like isoform X2 [Scleropages formosus]|uniref:leucine zipper protein 2-like isoform X2 n=1 Tax=Scleropages formosus TaxID=113540 RepID=UPI000877F87E|nr:leucine zipper protein 2 isoform X2 [Scleropages formosus]